MVKFIIKSINAEKNLIAIKRYDLASGLNIIQSENTSQGKTTLVGIIDYCLNGRDVFPWREIETRYDSVSIIVQIGEKPFLIRRGLLKDKKVKIFGGKNFKIEINTDITTFILEELGIKHSSIFSAGKKTKISIRDYAKLFFMRQLDTKNLEGNVFAFNKVVQAGKIVLGLEEKGMIETNLKLTMNKLKNKKDYLERLRDDLGRNIEEIKEESLESYKKNFEEINNNLLKFEEELSKGKTHKAPLVDKLNKIEKEIRFVENTIQKINEDLLDNKLLKKEITRDYEMIRKSEISLELLDSFPDKKCPECNVKNDSEENFITCKICGRNINDKKDLISNFYKITKNIERDLITDENRIRDNLKSNEEKLTSLREEYSQIMNQLGKIEKNIILRFTNEIKDGLNKRDILVKNIRETQIKLEYKSKLIDYKDEINILENSKKRLEKELSESKGSLKRFELHKKLVEEYLSILNMRFNKLEWKEENIFPSIDGKGLGSHGGSDSVRVLSSVLSSLFELSLRDKDVKLPSTLVIDSLRKHEIELEELEAIGKRWVDKLKGNQSGQIILTGVEIPDYLIKEAKNKGKYYHIKSGEYTL